MFLSVKEVLKERNDGEAFVSFHLFRYLILRTEYILEYKN